MNKEKPALAGAGRRKGVKYYQRKDTKIFQLLPEKLMSIIKIIEKYAIKSIYNYRRDNLFQILSTIIYGTKNPNKKYGAWTSLELAHFEPVSKIQVVQCQENNLILNTKSKEGYYE
jgi:hypothetical protein